MPLTSCTHCGVLLFVVAISLLVLLEWYILGSSQSWTSCRVTGYYSLMQTLVDSGNLFLKTESLGQIICGLSFFSFALLCISFSCSYVVLLGLLSFLSLSLLVATFTSSNSFALISFLRVILISISFDIVMCFYLIACIYLVSTISCFFLPLFLSFCLMELGRTPYDLLESESELVSSYNIEFGSFGFTLLFLGEYSSFFWIIGLLSILFSVEGFFSFYVFLVLVTIRAVLPRLKFVQVLNLSWSIINLSIFLFYSL